ncbi:MAG: hypothetical protein JXJ04_16790 [Spirochaetales bacterium]|nr:hypothetical protein [Spirochaetales bacterium]
MQITIFETFVAFSETKNSVLIKEKRFSPEGSEVLSFIIIDCENKQYKRFELSHNFGNENKGVSEEIPEKKFKAITEELSASLLLYGFTGIDVCTDACKTENREKCLSISPHVLNINKQAFFGTEKQKLVRHPFYIRIHGQDLALYKDSKKKFTWRPEYVLNIKQMQAWISPDNRLIVLFSFFNFNHHRIIAILVSDKSTTYERYDLRDMKGI